MSDGAGDPLPLRTPRSCENDAAAVSIPKSGSGGPEERSSSNDSNQDLLDVDQQWEEKGRLLLQERLARANLMPWPSNTPDLKAVSAEQQQSDDGISSLSSGSQQTSLAHDTSVISSIEGDSSDTSSKVRQQHSADVLDYQASDSLELNESLSSLNESIEAVSALAGEEDDACRLSLPSSISSLSSSSSPRSNTQIKSGDLIDNTPQLLAQDCGRAGDNQAWTDRHHWEWSEYVKPDARSSLSSLSDINLDLSSDDEDNSKTTSAPLLEPVDKALPTADLFPSHSPPAPSPKVTPPEFDAYIGFDELAGVFDEFFPLRDAEILDVGCGTSSVCRQLALHGFSDIQGIDNSPSAIAFQRQEAEGLDQLVRFYDMNLSALMFPDSHFDCVFSKAVLDKLASLVHYGQDSELQRVLSEITRCLRPGGLWVNVSWVLGGEGPIPTLWWDWPPVTRFVADNYVQVKTYRCGAPFVHRGELFKPFAVQIYRKRETLTHKLERCAWISFNTKQVQRLAKIQDKWKRERLQQRVDLAVAERELPLMIREEHELRLKIAGEVYERQRLQRVRRRAALRAFEIMQERLEMGEEDALAECVRIIAAQVTELARSILRECVGDALLMVGTSTKAELASGGTTSAIGVEAALLPVPGNEQTMKSGDTINAVASNASSIDIEAVDQGVSTTRPEEELKVASTSGSTVKEALPRELASQVVTEIIRDVIAASIAYAESVNIKSDHDEHFAAAVAESEGDTLTFTSTTDPTLLKADSTVESSESASTVHAEPTAGSEDENPFAVSEGDTLELDLAQTLLSGDHTDPTLHTTAELRPELPVDLIGVQHASSLPPSEQGEVEDAVQLCLFELVDRAQRQSQAPQPLQPPTSVGEASTVNGAASSIACVVHDAPVSGVGITSAGNRAATGAAQAQADTPIPAVQTTEQSGEDHDIQSTKPDVLSLVVPPPEPSNVDTDIGVEMACYETITALVDYICPETC